MVPNFQALTDDQKEMLSKLAAECIKQSGATTQAVSQAMSNVDSSNASASVKAYAHCLMHKSGKLVNEKIQPAVLIQAYGPTCGLANVNAIMAKCNGLKGKDNHETAFLLLHCYTAMRRQLKCSQ